MKKILLVCSILFNTLAMIGGVYVLSLKGTVNAGYAVVPMVIGMACLSAYRVLPDNK